MAELTTRISANDAFAESDRIVELLRQGDEEAFEQVFHLYRDMVYTLALKILADKGDALDVTQEVFLTLYRKAHTFRGDSSLKTWLYRVAVNQASNRNRWWKRRRKHRTVSLNLSFEDAGEHVIQLESESPSPSRDCFSVELKDALNRELKKLPFDQRVAVTLREVEGLSYEEIAEVVGARVGTVKSRISRGRERLRKALQAYRGGESL